MATGMKKEKDAVDAASNSGGLSRYISSLKGEYAKYARPAHEVRRLIDESMGAPTLTGLLYKQREDGST